MAVLYDPRYHTFVSWADLMVEQFASNQLEIPNQKTDWRQWGRGLKSIGVFANEAIPDPDQYGDWSDWASALINTMNGNV
jgi:hypothetical protein